MKKAITIYEQIDLLKQRGLIVDDVVKASEQLMDIGYYRLGFYLFPFEKSYPDINHRNHLLHNNVTFNDVVSLYYFDADLRNLLIYYINRIEISLRTYLTYTVSVYYQSNRVWFVDPTVVNKSYADCFNEKVYKTIMKNPIIKRHHIKYINDKYAPAWKTLEFMTLGNVLLLYDNLRDESIKFNIANRFGFKGIKAFCNYMDVIRVIRNSCAHGACIYNIRLPKGIVKGPIPVLKEENRHNICGAIDVVYFVLKSISDNRANELKDKISDLLMQSNLKPIVEVIKRSSNLSL